MSQLPEGFQQVYVHFSGKGDEQLFTAPSNEAASEFISSQKDVLTKWSSAWVTQLYCKATDYSGFFRGTGVPVACVNHNSIEIKPQAESIENV